MFNPNEYKVVSEEAVEHIILGRWHKLPADKVDMIKADCEGAIFDCREGFFERMRKHLIKHTTADGLTIYGFPHVDACLNHHEAVDGFFKMTGAKAVFRWLPADNPLESEDNK